MSQISFGKPNGPTLDWLDRSLTLSNTVGPVKKWRPTGNFQLCFKSLQRHLPHRCSMSTFVNTVYTPHCDCLTVWIRPYLHRLISHTTKSVIDLRYVSVPSGTYQDVTCSILSRFQLDKYQFK